jgi:malate synthase
LTPEAQRFLKDLHTQFEPKRRKLLAKRKLLQVIILIIKQSSAKLGKKVNFFGYQQS